ncbi:MAG TPA: methylmalonyl Co-A mutase-associated GTPase MeaB [Miltoncostaeaceae bacterium]|nr:methylmalonyl Co-A mutase-associated GTPase MeaB [Miltoncostaeaceae bacterium]
MMDVPAVVAGVLAGERRAVGRAISMVESLGDEGRAIVRALHPHAGRAERLGLTGAPGVGKSTLASALIRTLREEGRTIGVVSVDPTSPFTRGAVLGDRIRLTEHFLDRGVFIRSMATRGHAGGLAEATADAVLVLDAAGYDVVMVETVGAGQTEVEVGQLAETVVLVLMPGAGDAIQAIKAGLMEIPDVLVVNKADRPGADLMRAELEGALGLVSWEGWRPPIVATRAVDGEGIGDLAAAIARHRAHLVENGVLDARRRDGLARQLRSLALDRFGRRVDDALGAGFVEGLVDEVLSGRLDPASAVDEVVERADRPAGSG